MANVARLAARFVTSAGTGGATVDSIVTFHVKAVDSHAPFTAGDLSLLCAQTWDWWRFDALGFTAVRAGYSANTALVDVTAHTVQPATSDPVVDARDPVVGANVLQQPLPPQCAVGVTLVTDDDSRRGRGRLFLPAPPKDWADPVGAHKGDGWNVAGRWLAKLAAHIQEVYGPFGPFVLAVYSRLNGTANAVTGFRVASHVVTQRRRRVFPRDYLFVPITG